MSIRNVLETAQQLINGTAYDFSTIKVMAGPRVFSRISAINYEHGIEQSELRGTSSFVLARTNGQYSASGSMTIYKEDFDELIGIVMAMPVTPGASMYRSGWMQKQFPIVINYSDPTSGKVLTDTLQGVRITRHRDNHSVGTDALMSELDLSIMRVITNGKSAVL